MRSSEATISLLLTPNGKRLANWGLDSQDLVARLLFFKNAMHALLLRNDKVLMVNLESPADALVFSLQPDELLKAPFFLSASDGRLLLSCDDSRGVIGLWETATGKLIAHFSTGVNLHSTGALSFDTRLLAIPTENMTIQLWDLSGLPLSAPFREDRPLGKPLLDAWQRLQDDHPATAHNALCRLLDGRGAAVDLIRRQLLPLQSLSTDQFARYMQRLDSKQFSVREMAMRELQSFDELVEPLIRNTLLKSPTPEVRRRLQELLDRISSLHTKRLLSERAVAILEYIDSLEARSTLAELASGPAAAYVTQDAKRALQRSRQRCQDRQKYYPGAEKGSGTNGTSKFSIRDAGAR